MVGRSFPTKDRNNPRAARSQSGAEGKACEKGNAKESIAGLVHNGETRADCQVEFRLWLAFPGGPVLLRSPSDVPVNLALVRMLTRPLQLSISSLPFAATVSGPSQSVLTFHSTLVALDPLPRWWQYGRSQQVRPIKQLSIAALR